jgi:hypothetical protein
LYLGCQQLINIAIDLLLFFLKHKQTSICRLFLVLINIVIGLVLASLKRNPNRHLTSFCCQQLINIVIDLVFFSDTDTKKHLSSFCCQQLINIVIDLMFSFFKHLQTSSSRLFVIKKLINIDLVPKLNTVGDLVSFSFTFLTLNTHILCL